MTPLDALFELFGREGECQGAPILVNDEELHQWPSAAVKAMKSQRLLAKARPASSAICSGCERECVMPVHSLASTAGAQTSFVVCDKRSDVNRVVIPAERLTQWQCSAGLVSGFIATSLGLRPSVRKTDIANRWEIGISFAEKRSQMLCLEANGTLALVVADNMVPLTDLVEFHGGEYGLDKATIRRLVDTATTADARYTPSSARREARRLDTQAMYESWKKEYRKLRKRRPSMTDVWYSRQIAKMDDISHNRDAETIRKHMKK